MSAPLLPLGVAVMDEDHAQLESLLGSVAGVPDPALPDLLSRCEAETRAHFEHEEALMRDRGVPILHCHMQQHALFLAEFQAGHDAVATGDSVALRRFLAQTLPRLLLEHVDSVDRVTAAFLQQMEPAPVSSCGCAAKR